MIAENIRISKEQILSKYSNLDEKVKSIIEKLYEIEQYNEEHQVENFDIKIKKTKIGDMVKIKDDNNLQELNFVDSNTGVYIFLDECNVPVYIGFGGKGDVDSLKVRISDQLRGDESNANLVKNIKDIENLLNPNISLPEDRKGLILKYTSSLIVIDCGKQETDNIKFAQALEVILIALFNSKYNK